MEPQYGCKRIARTLKNQKIDISPSSAWRILLYNNLNSFEKRLEFVKDKIAAGVITPSAEQLQLINTKERGFLRGMTITNQFEKTIIDIVLAHPNWGLPKIVKALQKKNISISASGIKGLLIRNNLNSLDKRLTLLVNRINAGAILPTKNQLRLLDTHQYNKSESDILISPEIEKAVINTSLAFPTQQPSHIAKTLAIQNIILSSKEVHNIWKQYKLTHFSKRIEFLAHKIKIGEIIPNEMQQRLVDANLSSLPRRIPFHVEKALISIAILFPHYGSSRILQELSDQHMFVSKNSLSDILYEHNLDSFEKRLASLESKIAVGEVAANEFQLKLLKTKQKPLKHTNWHKDELEQIILNLTLEFPHYGASKIAKKLHGQNIQVSEDIVHRTWRIHNLTYFKNRLAFLEAKVNTGEIIPNDIQALVLKTRGHSFSRQIAATKVQAILDMCIAFPDYGYRRLSDALFNQGIEIPASSIENVLKRNNLNEFSKRIELLKQKVEQQIIIPTEHQLMLIKTGQRSSPKRISTEIENIIVNTSISFPNLGSLRCAQKLKKQDIQVSYSVIQNTWQRHNLNSFEKRLQQLKSKIENGEIIPTPSQLALINPAPKSLKNNSAHSTENKNRLYEEREQIILNSTSLLPHFGIQAFSKELQKQNIFIPASVVEKVWKNNNLNSFEKRLFFLEEKVRNNEVIPNKYQERLLNTRKNIRSKSIDTDNIILEMSLAFPHYGSHLLAAEFKKQNKLITTSQIDKAWARYHLTTVQKRLAYLENKINNDPNADAKAAQKLEQIKHTIDHSKASAQQEREIINMGILYPDYGYRRLAWELSKQEIHLAEHIIQNVLKRHNLYDFEKRLALLAVKVSKGEIIPSETQLVLLNTKTKTSPKRFLTNIENAIINMAGLLPHYGPKRLAKELSKQNISVSYAGIASVLQRYNLDSFEERLKLLENKINTGQVIADKMQLKLVTTKQKPVLYRNFSKEEIEQKVIEISLLWPERGQDRIVEELKKLHDISIAASVLHKIWKRLNLNSIKKRIAFLESKVNAGEVIPNENQLTLIKTKQIIYPRSTPAHIEEAIISLSLAFPDRGSTLLAKDLYEKNIAITISTIHKVWRRYSLTTKEHRLKALESRIRTGEIIPNEYQLQALQNQLIS